MADSRALQPLPGLERPFRIGPLPVREDERAVRMLARAFRDNPLDVAVIGGRERERLRAVAWGMRTTLASARQASATRILAAFEPGRTGPVGILVGIPSAALPLPPAPLWLQLRSTLGQGLRVGRRWATVFHTLESQQPRDPHWYLSLVGVDPPHCGLGIGRALLQSWLASIDPDGLPSYLETDREANLAFYAKAGFEVVSRLEVLGTPVWCMRRTVSAPEEGPLALHPT